MLDCNGINSTITATPSPIVFNQVLVGNSGMQSTTLQNTGGSPVMVDNFQLMASGGDVAFATPPAPQMLAGGGMMTVDVTYTPVAPHPAGAIGTMSFRVGGTATQSVGIQGEAAAGTVGTNPATVEFGPLCAGNASKPLAIFANGPGRIMLSAVTPPAAPFTSTAASAVLQPNHANEATSMITLGSTTPGEYNGVIGLSTNIPGAQPSVPVHATLLPPGVGATPDKAQFGSIPVTSTTTGREIVFTNCSSGTVVVTGAHVTGPATADFTIVAPADPAQSLAQFDQEKFLVVMTPHALGLRSAQLVIDHDGTTSTADLEGTGLGSGGTKDRETYYACTTGHPSNLAPLALALMLARRRRRRRG
jgi:hypothetical protein